jgi:hypothetical protein
MQVTNGSLYDDQDLGIGFKAFTFRGKCTPQLEHADCTSIGGTHGKTYNEMGICQCPTTATKDNTNTNMTNPEAVTVAAVQPTLHEDEVTRLQVRRDERSGGCRLTYLVCVTVLNWATLELNSAHASHRPPPPLVRFSLISTSFAHSPFNAVSLLSQVLTHSHLV